MSATVLRSDGIGQDFRLLGVHSAIRELVMAADMVEMGVTGDRHQGPLTDQPRMIAQADNAHAAVDQQISVATPDMPDIAAKERLDVGFPDQGNPVVKPSRLVPLIAGYGAICRVLRHAAFWRLATTLSAIRPVSSARWSNFHS